MYFEEDKRDLGQALKTELNVNRIQEWWQCCDSLTSTPEAVWRLDQMPSLRVGGGHEGSSSQVSEICSP